MVVQYADAVGFMSMNVDQKKKDVDQKKKTPYRSKELTPSRPIEGPMIPTPASLTIASSTTVAAVADNSRKRLAVNGGDNSLPMVGNICIWN